ncbi:hypothetical protein JB92DRAFT_3127309 [Gautieria morchelliformis]|nr:hypothetical protein JB92DRAFT_3127309 [Gautieria morchelliformis]
MLSGTTWKGAKPRIGEARLDYTQRLANERKRPAKGKEERHLKRRRLLRGVHRVHAGDTSVVSLKNHTLHPVCTSKYLHLLPLHPTSGVAQNLPRTRYVADENAPRAPATRQSLDAKNKKREKLCALAVPTQERGRRGAASARAPAHARSASPSSRASVQSVPQEDGRQGSKATGATGGEESRAMPDLQEEKARDPELMMTMFGDDEREWACAESAEDEVTDVPTGLDESSVSAERADHAQMNQQNAQTNQQLARINETLVQINQRLQTM